MRECAQFFGRMDPLVRLTVHRAAWCLVTTAQTESRLRAMGCTKVSVMAQVGLPAGEIQQLAAIPARHADAPFRLFSLGRLLHWKGFELALLAFAKFAERVPGAEYWLIGDGPERE